MKTVNTAQLLLKRSYAVLSLQIDLQLLYFFGLANNSFSAFDRIEISNFCRDTLRTIHEWSRSLSFPRA